MNTRKNFMQSESERSIPRQLALDMADSILVAGGGLFGSGLIMRLSGEAPDFINNLGETVAIAGFTVGAAGFALRGMAKLRIRDFVGVLKNGVPAENTEGEADLLQNQV